MYAIILLHWQSHSILYTTFSKLRDNLAWFVWAWKIGIWAYTFAHRHLGAICSSQYRQ